MGFSETPEKHENNVLLWTNDVTRTANTQKCKWPVWTLSGRIYDSPRQCYTAISLSNSLGCDSHLLRALWPAWLSLAITKNYGVSPSLCVSYSARASARLHEGQWNNKCIKQACISLQYTYYASCRESWMFIFYYWLFFYYYFYFKCSSNCILHFIRLVNL